MLYHVEVARFKKALLLHALQACGGSRTRAAEKLGLARPYLHRLMRQLTVKVAVPAPHKNGGRRRR